MPITVAWRARRAAASPSTTWRCRCYGAVSRIGRPSACWKSRYRPQPSWSRRSVTREARVTLLQEGSHALRFVHGAEERHEALLLQVERGRQGKVGARIDGLLGHR